MAGRAQRCAVWRMTTLGNGCVARLNGSFRGAVVQELTIFVVGRREHCPVFDWRALTKPYKEKREKLVRSGLIIATPLHLIMNIVY
jgi:hypothetical protein